MPSQTDFKKKYLITPRYLTKPSKRRSGRLITPAVKFVVAHDTGNRGSTAAANVRHYEATRDAIAASAHLFVDDKEIIECIPALEGQPEKAWHVLYSVPTDNQLYGFDANDAALGIEYCHGDNIDADEAYRKYVWVLAYACYKFSLDPKTSVVGHFFLDPQRRTDPITGLKYSRRTYDQLLRNVVEEHAECTQPVPPQPPLSYVENPGIAQSTVRLNIRKAAPTMMAEVVQTVPAGTRLEYTGWVTNGETINGNPKWFRDINRNYFWSGGTRLMA